MTEHERRQIDPKIGKQLKKTSAELYKELKHPKTRYLCDLDETGSPPFMLIGAPYYMAKDIVNLTIWSTKKLVLGGQRLWRHFNPISPA